MTKPRPDEASPDASELPIPEIFESFDLSIESHERGYRAVLMASPVGERKALEIAAARLDFEIEVRDSDRTDSGRTETEPATKSSSDDRDLRRREIKPQDLKNKGLRLFRSVFSGQVGEAYRESLARVRSEGRGLALRLRLDDAPELAGLPWEALWDPHERAFLADPPDIPILRSMRVAKRPLASEGLDVPARLVSLLPEPKGQKKLSGAKEWKRIGEHLEELAEDGTVQLESLQPASLQRLGERIDEGRCDVLHIVAHGGVGDRGANGVLHLEDAEGNLNVVSGTELARVLEQRQKPRLVVINACHGARSSFDDAFDGLAQHLLSRGVMVIVAMRTSISDGAAVSFATVFYERLATGATLEAALIEARRSLSVGKYRMEWATPVLYMRDENLQLFAQRASAPIHHVDPPEIIPRRWFGLLIALLILIAGGAKWWPTSVDAACPEIPGLPDLRMVLINPGVVESGDSKITVQDAFCISTHEVTRETWNQVMGADRLTYPGWPMNWPVTGVMVDDALEFLQRLDTRVSEAGFRLPTATEWEYAARAGAATDYSFGDDPADLDRYGNCRNRFGSDGYDGLAPVGSYRPNAWGLYDVHGNASEWVLWPAEGEPVEVINGEEMVLRLGGDFNNVRRHCTFRGSRSDVQQGYGHEQTGFRIVRTPTNASRPSSEH